MGQNGLYARKHLEAERLRLLENHKTLEQSYKDFLNTRENLKNDHDMLSVYARQLGYGRGDEKFIRIKGLNVAVNANMATGQVLYATNSEFVSDKIIKIISVCFGFAVLVFFCVRDIFLST